ncbi:hypothetical protein SAMN05518683_108145 [Salibacterium halotolerans]|uniref:Uncharacterized protein n=1 Tax=Salibacterium halotolerans TaxID=1884432 RepID=A0A1I5SDV4_9BACI|nr:hypothetical protein SAMN05518683_108145 [Salibacterium halotolerans]
MRLPLLKNGKHHLTAPIGLIQTGAGNNVWVSILHNGFRINTVFLRH